ncbi:ABC transporter permease subunit [Agromyces humatus]|uniref:ABC transporter permease n=1 Tax=Agromyces humatus TaxID=279573 RepID=A0ABN2KSY0_9MICO|nr:ABC transporter permease subunit [Agromyces humatus]
MSTSIAPRVTFARVIRSEWIKTGTVRSTYWTAALTLAVTLLFAVGILYLVLLAPAADVPDPNGLVTENYGATPSVGVLGLAFMFAYALVAILGVLAVSPERATGLLATTLAAVPRRTPVYAAKLLVSASIGVLIALVVGTAAVLIVQPALAGLGLDSSFFDAEVLQSLAGGAVFLGLIAVLSTAIASLFRGTAAAMGVVLGLLVFAPALVPIIPGIGATVAAALPSSAGMMLFQSAAQVGWQPIVTGGLVLLGWTAGAAVLGGMPFKRRDV